VRHPLVGRIVDAYDAAHQSTADITPLLKPVKTPARNVRKK